MARELKNILVNRIHDAAVTAAIKHHARGRLLDIGCGTKPYREPCSRQVSKHIGIDHPGTPHPRDGIDAYSDAYRTPFGDQSFDTVLCTAVLEHLEEPEEALQECHRVLAGGGVAIYSVPFIWHLHEQPRDFYRFSRYGLRHLFEKVGFEVEELHALSGFWVTFGQLLVYYLYRFHIGPLRLIPLIPLVGLLIQGLSYVADRLDRPEEWTWMYLLTARKGS